MLYLQTIKISIINKQLKQHKSNNKLQQHNNTQRNPTHNQIKTTTNSKQHLQATCPKVNQNINQPASVNKQHNIQLKPFI